MRLNKSVNLFLVVVATVTTIISFGAGQSTQPDVDVKPESNPSKAAGTNEFPDSWYMKDPITKKRYAGWQEIEGFATPRLKIHGWAANGIDLEELKGKVVVVNFWSLECGPCLLQFPKNVELANRLASDDFIWLSIHDDSISKERLPATVRQFQPGHPIGVDQFDISSRAWNVPAHPFYYILDRAGTVRAMGLKRRRVAQVVKQLLEEPYKAPQQEVPRPEQPQPSAQNAKSAVIPKAWLEGTDQERRLLANQMNFAKPLLPESEKWLNTEALTEADLNDKVVMLDFWATWCMPCRNAVPKTNELYEKYKEKGLEIIGVCHPRGAEKMATIVEQWGIKFPVCADTKGLITEAYRVNGWPDYYFIDRSGTLRVIDGKNAHVEEIVKALLNEPRPKPRTAPDKNNAVLTE